jgi:hypothetical protein
VRKPKQYAVSAPGDLVEVDTLDVRPVPRVVFKQFTARDVVSRWDVIQAHTRATAFTAAEFLHYREYSTGGIVYELRLGVSRPRRKHDSQQKWLGDF